MEKTQAQAKAEGGGSRSNTKRKGGPPEVEEGTEAIRKRRGSRRKKPTARNFMLKPMRSIAPLVRCDPARLERIRLKERYHDEKASKSGKKESEMPAISCPFSVPFSVELAEGYRSTPSAPTMPTTASTSREPSRSSTSEIRANNGNDAKHRFQRSDFNKIIRHEIDAQASRAAKRRKMVDHSKPDPPPSRDACRNLSTESTKGKTNDKGDKSQRVSEFRSVREKSVQDAISRLLSRGDRNSEPHEEV